jgi:hypothetical protein
MTDSPSCQGSASLAIWFFCSASPGQRAAAIEGPHDAIGANEAKDGAATQRS